MAFGFVFCGIPECGNKLGLCVFICLLCFFLGSFPFVCFALFWLFVCVLSYYNLFYCIYPLETCLFPNKRKKRDGCGWGGVVRTGRSRWRGIVIKYILYENNKLKVFKNESHNNSTSKNVYCGGPGTKMRKPISGGTSRITSSILPSVK